MKIKNDRFRDKQLYFNLETKSKASKAIAMTSWSEAKRVYDYNQTL